MGACFTVQDASNQEDANDHHNHMEVNKPHHDRDLHSNADIGSQKQINHEAPEIKLESTATANIRDIMKDRAQKRVDHDSIHTMRVLRSISTCTNLSTKHQSISEPQSLAYEDISASVPSVASSEALYDAVSEKDLKPTRTDGETLRFSHHRHNKTNSNAEGIKFELQSVISEGIVKTEMIQEAR